MSITIEVSVDCFDKYGGLTNQNPFEHLKIVSFVAKNEKKSFKRREEGKAKGGGAGGG